MTDKQERTGKPVRKSIILAITTLLPTGAHSDYTSIPYPMPMSNSVHFLFFFVFGVGAQRSTPL